MTELEDKIEEQTAKQIQAEEENIQPETVENAETTENVTAEESSEEVKAEDAVEEKQAEVEEIKPVKKEKTKKVKKVKIVEEDDENHEEKILKKYNAKKNFKKKLTYLICIGISLVLVTAIFVLGCVQVNVKPHFLSDSKVVEYEIYQDNAWATSIGEESENYNTLTANYNKAFAMSILSAMITGQTGDYKINETSTKFDTSNIKTLVGSEEGNYIKVSFDEALTVLNSNKTVYKSIRNSQAEKLTFNEFYFALPETNGFQDITLVIPVYGNYIKNGTVDTSIPTVTTITVNVNLYHLSLAVEELINK